MGEISLSLQAKLLRAIETRQVTRVGATKPRSVDVRFVAATNRDLEEEVEAKRFRQDLYFRLNGISLTIPPLRERTDEIAALALLFLERVARPLGVPRRRCRPRRARLAAYGWPGNIRELRNVMERALLLCPAGRSACGSADGEAERRRPPGARAAPARSAACPPRPAVCRPTSWRPRSRPSWTPSPAVPATRRAPPSCWVSPGGRSARG